MLEGKDGERVGGRGAERDGRCQQDYGNFSSQIHTAIPEGGKAKYHEVASGYEALGFRASA